LTTEADTSVVLTWGEETSVVPISLIAERSDDSAWAVVSAMATKESMRSA